MIPAPRYQKLTPLTEDVIEISCNDDYTQGIEDAIDKLDTDSKSSDIFYLIPQGKGF